MPSQLLTVKEVATLLGVNPLTIIRLYDKGEIPGIILKEGARKRMIRFRQETIHKFITEREMGTKH